MADTSTLKYTATHEWVKIEDGIATIGITKHAEEELGDVALVQLPEVGRILQPEDKFGEVESIKAVSELYSPVGGEVIAVNDALTDAPENVNSEPYDSGWMIKIRLKNIADADSLLDEAGYAKLIES